MSARECSRRFLRTNSRNRRASHAVLSFVLLLVLLPPFPAGAATTSQQLAALRKQIAVAQRDADRFAAQYADALARSATLHDEIAATAKSIRAKQIRLRAMRAVVRERAAFSYMAAVSGSGQLSSLFGASDVIEAARTTRLLNAANQKSNDLIERYGQSSHALEQRVASLTRAERRENAIVLESEATAKRINDRLVELDLLRARLESRQEAERVAQQARAAQAAQDARAAARTRQATTPTTIAAPDSPPDLAGPPSQPPAGGSRGLAICPIRGPVSFTDTWNDPRPGGRLHQGVDLLSPFGTPNVAVTSGRIVHNSGANQGNGIFLHGDNGTTYYYFHLSSYAGGPRRVQAGEVIGYVGATGETTANHTHFEIHPGGGGPINPYPAARSVC